METKIYMIAEWLTYNHQSILFDFELTGLDDVEDFIYTLAETQFTKDVNPEELNLIFDDIRINIIIDFLFKGVSDEQTHSLH